MWNVILSFMVAMALGHAALAERTHSGGAGAARDAADPIQQPNLGQIIDSCFKGRPGGRGFVGGGSGTQALSLLNTCMSCHDPIPAVTPGQATEAVLSGRMPKGRALSQAERARIVQLLGGM